MKLILLAALLAAPVSSFASEFDASDFHQGSQGHSFMG
jgi:hypothetical protein